MSEEQIVKELVYWTKQWRNSGFISTSLKGKLDRVFFYKDWDIARIANKNSRHKAFLTKRDKECQYPGCTETENLTQDHVYPKSKGGKEGLHNKQLLCLKHNQRKNDKLIPAYVPHAQHQ